MEHFWKCSSDLFQSWYLLAFFLFFVLMNVLIGPLFCVPGTFSGKFIDSQYFFWHHSLYKTLLKLAHSPPWKTAQNFLDLSIANEHHYISKTFFIFLFFLQDMSSDVFMKVYAIATKNNLRHNDMLKYYTLKRRG